MAPRRVEESPGAQRRSGLCLNEIPRRQYFVYIVASSSRAIYIGMTNDLERRMYEHKLFKGFTAKHGVDRFVFMEDFSSVYDAIAGEKSLRGGGGRGKSC